MLAPIRRMVMHTQRRLVRITVKVDRCLLSELARPVLQDGQLAASAWLERDTLKAYPQVEGVPELKLSPQPLQRLCGNCTVMRLWAIQEDVVPDLAGQGFWLNAACTHCTCFRAMTRVVARRHQKPCCNFSRAINTAVTLRPSASGLKAVQT